MVMPPMHAAAIQDALLAHVLRAAALPARRLMIAADDSDADADAAFEFAAIRCHMMRRHAAAFCCRYAMLLLMIEREAMA